MNELPTNENYKEIINAVPTQQWQPLLDLIPTMETFYNEAQELFSQEPIDDAKYSQLEQRSNQLVSAYIKAVDTLPVVINFPWFEWDEGRKMAKDPTFDFNTIDIPDKCKILTAITRNNRFNEGVLNNAFYSGLFLRVFKSIQQQLK